MNLRSNTARKRQLAARSGSPLRVRLRNAAREAILETAEAAFCEKGIQAARVEEIAERAGVSVGTVYNYFGDRQGLVIALLESKKKHLYLTVDEALARVEGRPFAERLRVFLDVMIGHFQEHQRLFTIFTEDELTEMRIANPRHKSVIREMLGRVERLVQHAVDAGELRPEHASLYPSVIMGTLRNLFVRQVLFGNGKPLGVSSAQLVDLFLAGARRQP